MTTIQKLAKQIAETQGRLWEIGGCVRDGLMGRSFNDIDFAVEGLDYDKIISIVKGFAESVTETPVGKTAGVVKAVIEGQEYDFAMCRKETKTGEGHTGFVFDTNASILEDLERRDLTINAIAKDALTGFIYDPFGGRADINSRVIRHVSEAFAEDELRPLRVAKFAARYDFSVSDKTIALCKTMSHENLPSERIAKEIRGGIEGAVNPAKFFNVLNAFGWLETLLPEVHALIGCNQNIVHHPEGDAFNHTMRCLDICSPENRMPMLLHDIGKPQTTEWDGSKWTAHGHDKASVEITTTLLDRINYVSQVGKQEIERILLLVKHHMVHTTPEISRKKLAEKLEEMTKAGITVSRIVNVWNTDSKVSAHYNRSAMIDLEMRCKLIDTNPIVTGKMLQDIGYEQGANMGAILRFCKNQQFVGNLTEANWLDLVKKHF